MLNLIVVFTFSILIWKHWFWANVVQKIKNCEFKLNFGNRPNSNTLNLIMVFTFSFLNLKHPFLGKFGIKTPNMDSKSQTWMNQQSD